MWSQTIHTTANNETNNLSSTTIDNSSSTTHPTQTMNPVSPVSPVSLVSPAAHASPGKIQVVESPTNSEAELFGDCGDATHANLNLSHVKQKKPSKLNKNECSQELDEHGVEYPAVSSLTVKDMQGMVRTARDNAKKQQRAVAKSSKRRSEGGRGDTRKKKPPG
eukprot:SAG11_NODE_5859_length_1443_cov_1.469191_2_plen_164_part_00